jgi:hypothetical protein
VNAKSAALKRFREMLPFKSGSVTRGSGDFVAPNEIKSHRVNLLEKGRAATGDHEMVNCFREDE